MASGFLVALAHSTDGRTRASGYRCAVRVEAEAAIRLDSQSGRSPVAIWRRFGGTRLFTKRPHISLWVIPMSSHASRSVPRTLKPDLRRLNPKNRATGHRKRGFTSRFVNFSANHALPLPYTFPSGVTPPLPSRFVFGPRTC